MKNTLLSIVILLTLIVAADIYWWIKTALEIEGFENIIKEYISIFPGFIRNGRDVTYLRLFILGISISISAIMIHKHYYFIVSIFLLCINALVFVWSLFSLL